MKHQKGDPVILTEPVTGTDITAIEAANLGKPVSRIVLSLPRQTEATVCTVFGNGYYEVEATFLGHTVLATTNHLQSRLSRWCRLRRLLTRSQGTS